MQARIIAISGISKGKTFILTEGEVSIGREASNVIYLNEPSISRRHCVIKPEMDSVEGRTDGSKLEARTRLNDSPQSSPFAQGPDSEGKLKLADNKDLQFRIIDLESFNGTFVNGIPVSELTLVHGDQLTMGDVQFLFLTHEAAEPTALAAQLDEGDLITRSTVRLRREDAFYLHPEKVLNECPKLSGDAEVSDKTTRVARDLAVLLKVGTSINTISNTRQLQGRLLDLIPEILPAERGVILLVGNREISERQPVDEAQASFGSMCGWTRLTGSDDSIKVSQTIANQVLQEGVALLSNDLFESEGLGERPSLIAARVCSVLCVPLVLFNKPLGVIYLDTSDPASRFDEKHLQLLTAISGIAAVALENARQFEGLQDENRRLHQEVKLEHKMIGESAPMRRVYSFLAKVAPTQSTVLIRGESGTGKELAAYAIHLNSPRATKAFVAINCATLTETLLESELFGHEKGAFTGAITQKRGKLEIADGGTLFLDEVGELTPMIQAKLLRVLQEREFERVGGARSIKINVRIIAATNKELEEAIKSGGFRQDLYYRLNVVSIVMPPLRERREDISLLSSFFAAKYSKRCKRRVSGISAEARSALRSYDWPGNVRELENAIERAIVLGSSDSITLADLPESLLEAEHPGSTQHRYHDALRKAKQQILANALEQTGGNYTAAAKLLGIHPNNLHRMLRSLGLKTSLKIL